MATHKRGQSNEEDLATSPAQTIASIYHLGDATEGSIEEQIQSLARRIGHLDSNTMSAIVGCALCMPYKTNAYATLLAVLGADATSVLACAVEEVQAAPVAVPQFHRFVHELGLVRLLAGTDQYLQACGAAPFATEEDPRQYHLAFDECVEQLVPAPVPVEAVQSSLSALGKNEYVVELVSTVFEHNVAAAAIHLTRSIAAPELAEVLIRTSLMQESSPHALTRVQALLVQACLADRAFPPAMAKVLRASIGEPDPLRRFRLASWFAFHLSVFDYKWSWSEWIGLARDSSEGKFLAMLLDCLSRTSYGDRLKAVVPVELHGLLRSHEIERASYKYSGADAETQAAIRANTSVADTDRLVQTMLFMGCKTLSHTMAILERHAQLFKEHDPQRILESTLSYFGEGASGLLGLPCELVLHKLVSLGVLPSSTAQAYIDTLAVPPANLLGNK